LAPPPRLLLALLLGTPPTPAPSQQPPAIDKALPWAFEVKPLGAPNGRDPFTAATSSARWIWKSMNPVRRDEAGKSFLRFTLGRHEFDGAKTAEASLDAFMKLADPQMGFSYAWDYVVVDGARAWHLGVPCAFSGANFHKLVAKLLSEELGGKTPPANHVIECHCGGPCVRR
jgi:hypothetical protein